MKTMPALIFAGLVGVLTFELQNAILPLEAHAARFQVGAGPDWRQQMIAADRGVEGVDHSVARYTRTLGLTVGQEQQIRPLLQQRHDRILALLKKGSPALTLDQFMMQRHRISADMHDRLNAVLTDHQLQLEAQLNMGPRA